MPRLKAKELTVRELEIMQICWSRGELTVAEIRDGLEANGTQLAYTTVATLVRILVEKGILRQTHNERPFCYKATESYTAVSKRLLRDFLDSVFHGAREQLVLRLFEERTLTAQERAVLKKVLKESQK